MTFAGFKQTPVWTALRAAYLALLILAICVPFWYGVWCLGKLAASHV